MVIKLGRLIAALPAMEKLYVQPLPVRVAYRVAKTVLSMQPELEFFERERRKIDSEERMQELLETDVEVQVWPIKISDLGDISLTPQEAFLLTFLLEEDGDDNTDAADSGQAHRDTDGEQ